MLTRIDHILADHQQVVNTLHDMRQAIADAASLCKDCLNSGGKIFICGNGGSAADAQHFAAELTGRFERERPGLASIALTTDSSALTAIGNDFGFDYIFSRQLSALGQPGDLLIGISTSGNSINIIEAVKIANEIGLKTLGLLGRNGGELATLCQRSLTIPSDSTARIQEAHIIILHALCELIEN